MALWDVGFDLESHPERWNEPYTADVKNTWDVAWADDQKRCLGIGAALAQEVGKSNCQNMTRLAGIYDQLARDQGVQAQDWHFFWRRLEEIDGYISTAGC